VAEVKTGAAKSEIIPSSDSTPELEYLEESKKKNENSILEKRKNGIAQSSHKMLTIILDRWRFKTLLNHQNS
jgi:hypothetical protein